MIKSALLIIFFTVVLGFVSFVSGMNAAKAEIKIAVIDTGFDFKYKNKVKLCDNGHKDFTGTNLNDNHGHGTHISGLIAKEAKDYCIVIIKFFNTKSTAKNTLQNTISAINWAIMQNVDIINYSGGGSNAPDSRERAAVLKALNKGIIFVAAAGNENANLKRKPYYPAAYDKRIVVVGNLTNKGKRAPSSNYGGPIDLMVVGTNIRSVNGIMSGTSQSTAIVTGRIAKQLYIRKILKHQVELLGPVTTDKYWFEFYKYMAR